MKDAMRKLVLSVSLTLLLVAAACGSAPTQEEAAPAPADETEPPAATEQAPTGAESTETAGSAAEPGSFEAIYAEIEGLDPEARQERLIELAEEAGGTVNVYSTMNGEEGPESIALFEEQTGLNAEFYRASATDVLNRVLQENAADYANGADVITSNGTEMILLEREGMLAPVNTIAEEDEGFPEDAFGERWAWTYLNVFTPIWNTNTVTEGPTTWTEVLTNYPGQVVYDPGDWDWMAGVVPVLMEENGISEEEAMTMVGEAIGEAAAMIAGHTAMAQFVASGQYDISGTSYHSNGVDLKNEGAPVEWEPPVDPLIVRPNAAGLNIDAPNPAGAILFLDFFLTDAQEIMAKHGRQPANLDTPGGTLPPEYNTIVIDLEQLVDNQEKWESAYTEFVQNSGLPVQEG